LRLTLLRSSYDPDPLPDMGKHEFHFALVPHGKPLKSADLIRLGASYNRSLIPVGTDSHAGDLPAEGLSGASVRQSNVVLTSLKKAEDSDALIFRLLECDGKATTAGVTIDPALLGNAASVVEVDFIERELTKSTAKITLNGFSVHVPAYGVTSVKTTMKE
jgi:alpha-mannosidase